MKTWNKYVILGLILISFINCDKQKENSDKQFSEPELFSFDYENNKYKFSTRIQAVYNDSTDFLKIQYSSQETGIFDTISFQIGLVELDTIQCPFNIQYPIYGFLIINYNGQKYGLQDDGINSNLVVTNINNGIIEGSFCGYFCNYKLPNAIPNSVLDSIKVENGTFNIKYDKI